MHARPDRGGLALAVLSAGAFGTSGAFAASLLRSGWSPGAAVTARVVAAALLLTGPALAQLRGRWSVVRRQRVPLLAFGLAAVAGCQVCYFNAVATLSVGVALLLEYFGVVLVVLWLWVRHGQRPRRLTVLGGFLALAGLALMLDLLGSTRVDPVGVLWGLGAAAGLAGYFLLSASTREPLPPLAMAWAGMATGGIALLAVGATGLVPIRAPRTEVTLGGAQVSWVVPVLGLSLIAAVLAYAVGIAGARRLGARMASFVGLSEVVFAVAFAWVLLDQVPTPVQAVGGSVLLAGVALVRLEELRSPVPAPRPRGAQAAAVSGPAPAPPRRSRPAASAARPGR